MTPKDIKMAELLSEMGSVLQGAFSDTAKFARFLAVGHELVFAGRTHPMAEAIADMLSIWSFGFLPNLIESENDATVLFREEAIQIDDYWRNEDFRKRVETLTRFFIDYQEGEYPYADGHWKDFSLKLNALKRVGEIGAEYVKAELDNMERNKSMLD